MEGERWIDHFPSVLSIEVLRGRRQTSHQFSTDFMGVSRGLNHRFPCRVLLVSCFVLSSDRCDRFYNANPPHAISHRGGRFCHSSPPLHTFPQGVGGSLWHVFGTFGQIECLRLFVGSPPGVVVFVNYVFWRPHGDRPPHPSYFCKKMVLSTCRYSKFENN